MRGCRGDGAERRGRRSDRRRPRQAVRRVRRPAGQRARPACGPLAVTDRGARRRAMGHARRGSGLRVSAEDGRRDVPAAHHRQARGRRAADRGHLPEAHHRHRPRAGRPDGAAGLLRTRLRHRRAEGVPRRLRRAQPVDQPRGLRLREGRVAGAGRRQPARLSPGRSQGAHLRAPQPHEHDADPRAERQGRARCRGEVPAALRQEAGARRRAEGGPLRLRHLGRTLRRHRRAHAADDRLWLHRRAAHLPRVAALGLRLSPARHLAAQSAVRHDRRHAEDRRRVQEARHPLGPPRQLHRLLSRRRRLHLRPHLLHPRRPAHQGLAQREPRSPKLSLAPRLHPAFREAEPAAHRARRRADPLLHRRLHLDRLHRLLRRPRQLPPEHRDPPPLGRGICLDPRLSRRQRPDHQRGRPRSAHRLPRRRRLPAPPAQRQASALQHLSPMQGLGAGAVVRRGQPRAL